jgi:hypothetical protein
MTIIIHKDGQEIQVGDYIVVKSIANAKPSKHKVHRVTANYAIAEWGEGKEVKFHRIFKRRGFYPVGDSARFSSIEYLAGREA